MGQIKPSQVDEYQLLIVTYQQYKDCIFHTYTSNLDEKIYHQALQNGRRDVLKNAILFFEAQRTIIESRKTLRQCIQNAEFFHENLTKTPLSN